MAFVLEKRKEKTDVFLLLMPFVLVSLYAAPIVWAFGQELFKFSLNVGSVLSKAPMSAFSLRMHLFAARLTKKTRN